MKRRPPRSPLLPYTTLFRSRAAGGAGRRGGRVTSEAPAAEAHEHSHADVSGGWLRAAVFGAMDGLVTNTDRKSTRLNSSHANISYAVFCLKKKQQTKTS